MGNEVPKEMDFWTKEEYLKFSEAMMDKPRSFYAFEMLYWCGIRYTGEQFCIWHWKMIMRGCSGDCLLCSA